VLLWKAAFATFDAKGDCAVAQDCYNECIEYCDLVIKTRNDFIKSKSADRSYKMPRVIVNDSLPLVYPLTSSYIAADGSTINPNRFPHAPYEYLFANGCNHFYESIFEIQHDNLLSSLGNYEVPYFYGCATDEARKNFTPGVLSAPSYLALKNNLYRQTDFRRVNYIYSQSSDGKDLDKFGIVKYGHMGAKEDRTGMNTSLTGSDRLNFGKISYAFLENNNSGGRYFYRNYVNWIVYRISDVILMKAEALAMRNAGSDLNEAFGLIATIYNRSQTFYYAEENGKIKKQGIGSTDDELKTPSSASEMQLLVLEERQRELAFEGKRWFDLVRYALYTSKDGSTDAMFANTEMLKHKYSSNYDQYQAKMATINSLFFPIAEREINTNPLLKQNEAYVTENKYEKN
jgi:hypothetical protein